MMRRYSAKRESRSIFLDPTQSSMLPQSDLFPEASAPQVNPLAKESKKKRPVMQLVDLEAKDSDGEQSEASGSDGTEEEDDPSTRRATPNKKQMRDQQDELGTYSSFLSSFSSLVVAYFFVTFCLIWIFFLSFVLQFSRMYFYSRIIFFLNASLDSWVQFNLIFLFCS